jgi:virginiamycin B lyase
MSGRTIAGCPLNLAVDTLSSWRDNALPEGELRRIREHLSECLSCEQRLAEYDAVATALRRLSVPLPVGGYGRNPRLTARIALDIPSARRLFHLPTMLETLAALLVISLLASAFIRLRAPESAAPGAFATFPLPTAHSRPTSLVVGPDGALWFTEVGRGAIGRITPQGRLSEFPLVGADPDNLIIGPDGNLWFTETIANAIGRITFSGAITEFPLPGSLHPNSIATGADGNLWFTTSVPRHVVRLSPAGQVLGEYPLSATGGGLPVLARGPDGAVWFAVPGTPTIGRLRPDGTVSLFQSPLPVDGPLIAGPDGMLWVSAALGTRLERVSPQGAFATLPAGGPLIGAGSLPGTLTSLAAGPDGNVWFTLNPPASTTEQPWVGRITHGGALTLMRVPLAGKLGGLALGPDGNLWLTFFDLDRIGRLEVSGVSG